MLLEPLHINAFILQLLSYHHVTLFYVFKAIPSGKVGIIDLQSVRIVNIYINDWKKIKETK